MAAHESRKFWRTRCEQLIASGMRVHEWCDLNHVRAASMYAWLRRFHAEEPSMFGGIGLPEGMEGYGRGWYEAVRTEYAKAHSIVPQRPATGAFAVVDTGSLGTVASPPPPCRDGVAHAKPAITVTIGTATVSCPAGLDEPTLALVLKAVSAL